ncbi:MAG: formate dehydrogenase accessory sulfurtransferase FdhD [Candidatus Bathyarchaeota archaeon]|nr:formate dehydrogenase accessory sulfurtransferase FdhD [Candidatus Bathyarchaeota archaeon]
MEKTGMLIEYETLKFNQVTKDFEIVKDVVAIEDLISLYINGSLHTVFHCLPSRIEELIVGYLLTSGIIECKRDIIEMKISGRNIYIKLSEKVRFNASERFTFIATLCEGEIPPPYMLEVARKLRSNKMKISSENVFKAVEILNSRSPIFRASGGTHAAVLIDKDEIIAFAEDIGRHNAVDKVIGEAAMKDIDFGRLILASTGRLSSEIVIKAIRMGIPVLVSLSAPTSMGVRLAKAFGLTLIGFVRGGRFNIYSSPDRIEEWDGTR